MLYMPIIFLFYKENNLEVTELFGLHAIYSAIIAFFEVPSGYIADVWGRKPAMVIGTLFGTFGFYTYSISGNITGFLIAEVFLGIGHSLISGADSALLYDTLLEKGNNKLYVKLEGRITATGNIAEALAGIFVSVVAFSLYRYYYYCQTVFAFLAFVAALMLHEPNFRKRNESGFKDILRIVNTTLRKNRKLRNIILFSSLIGFASLTMAWFAQPIFDFVNIKGSNFGYAWVLLNFLVASGSIMANRISKILNFKFVLTYIIIFLCGGYIIVAYQSTAMVLITLSVFYFVRGTAHPVLKDCINRLTTSDKRATVLSVRSLVIRILYFSLGPVAGYLTDNVSLRFALILCGISVLLPLIVLFILIVINKH